MADDLPVELRAHRAAVAHLEACENALDEEQEGGQPEWPAELSAPYDGCMDCQVRETLTVAWPILEKG